MNEIVLASKYTKVSSMAWTVPPKKQPLRRKKLVNPNQKSTWAMGGVGTETMYSGDVLPRMFEETNKLLETQRFPDQEDFKQSERRMGQVMHSSDFIKKILRMNPNLTYEDSRWNKGHGAFYLIVSGEKVYTNACFKLGWIPEWTIMRTDTADLPTRDGLTYGWRTVVQRLVQKKAISLRSANAVFGTVIHGDVRGKNWALATRKFN